MKKTNRILSLVLAVIMIVSCASAAFAQSFSGTVSGDVTVLSGDKIAEGTVFNGNVIIDSGAEVENGIFNGAVTNNGTISGGTFKNTVTNNKHITGGTFKGSVINNYGKNYTVYYDSGISDGEFDGAVTNKANAIIIGGTFNSAVTNEANGLISTYIVYPTVNGRVDNAGTISGGVYNNAVTNTGSVTGGSFHNIISNSGTCKNVSAIVKSGNTYTVVGSPTVKSKVTASGNDASFVLNSGSTLCVDENTELDLNCPCTIDGKIVLEKGAKLVSNGGSLSGTPKGSIKVPIGASFTGTSASKFEYITYKEHKITVESNVDANQYTFTAANTAYKDANVSYMFDFSGTVNSCLILNSIKVYKGKKNDSNVIHASSDIADSFTMPDSDVIIYIDCVANHSPVSEHKDAGCTAAGYDRTYCRTCTHQLSYKEIPAKGHSWSAWAYNETDSKILKTRTCQECRITENAYIEIVNEVDGRNLTVDYKSTMTFHANVKTDSSYKLYWEYTSGGSTSRTQDNGSKSFTVTNALDDFTVKALVIGTVNDTSEAQNIKVKHGFFDKFIAFFRNLFKSLPVYIDNVKQ